MAHKLFVPLDCDFPDDPKIIAAGEQAEVLFIRMLCISKRILSDGVVSKVHVSRFKLKRSASRIQSLIAAGLIEECDDGYRIVAWERWNRSASDVREISEKRAIAGRKGGVVSGASRRNTKQVASSKPVATVEPREQSTESETLPPLPPAANAAGGSRSSGTNPRALAAASALADEAHKRHVDEQRVESRAQELADEHIDLSLEELEQALFDTPEIPAVKIRARAVWVERHETAWSDA